jgi:hypothetical protein
VYVPFTPPNHVIVDILYSNTIGGDYLLFRLTKTQGVLLSTRNVVL